LSKHQKEIVRAINDGAVYDIHSYLLNFGRLKEFIIDKALLEEKFKQDENGKTYKVLKPGLSPMSISFDPVAFKTTATNSVFTDKDYMKTPAKLVFNKIALTKAYRGTTYTFNLFNGINIAKSIRQIKEFLVVWAFLHKELFVLELPKSICKEEIGLFFVEYNKKEREDRLRNAQRQSAKMERLTTIEISQLNFPISGKPEIDAFKYADKFLEFNEEEFISCEYYLDKKITGTPALELFIKRRFKTTEQVNFFWALVPAYIAILISIFALVQKPDNSENVKIQHQLTQIQQDISKIDSSNSALEKIFEELTLIRTGMLDEHEIELILIEIEGLIRNMVE
jgi:hypothetical protein